MGRDCDETAEGGMEIEDQLPEIFLTEDFKKIVETFVEEDRTEEIEKDQDKSEESRWPEYEFIWQDFVPGVFSAIFLVSPTEVPSFLSIVSDVSDFLPNGALFFNFVFDWWFTGGYKSNHIYVSILCINPIL